MNPTNLNTFVKFHALLEFVGKQLPRVNDTEWVDRNQQESLPVVLSLFAYIGHVAKNNPELNVTSASDDGQEITKKMIEVATEEIKALLASEGF